MAQAWNRGLMACSSAAVTSDMKANVADSCMPQALRHSPSMNHGSERGVSMDGIALEQTLMGSEDVGCAARLPGPRQDLQRHLLQRRHRLLRVNHAHHGRPVVALVAPQHLPRPRIAAEERAAAAALEIVDVVRR